MYNPELEQEMRRESMKSNLEQQLNQQIDSLTRTGVGLKDIVRLLDAEEFLSAIGNPRNPVLRFDVKSFIKSKLNQSEGDQKIERIILPDSITQTHKIILPADEGEILTGSGKGMEEKEVIPRTSRFIALLSEMNLHYSVLEGRNDPKMMRSLSYLVFSIPEIQKLALINDEEGNATFIINNFDPEIESLEAYTSMTKDQLKELPHGKMTFVSYPGTLEEWCALIKVSLENKNEILAAPVHSETEPQLEKVPEGWLTHTEVKMALGVARETVLRIVERQKPLHPEWFQRYLNSNNQPHNYYAPELVEIVINELAARNIRPLGWMTNPALAKELGVTHQTIIRIAESQKLVHPDWQKQYVDPVGKLALHYSPELVDHIKKVILSREKAPEGWVLRDNLAKQLDADPATIEKIAEEKKQEHPEWFKQYLNSIGKLALHFSPQLVEYVTKVVSLRGEKAPDGWDIVKNIAIELGSAVNTIKRIAQSQKLAHPEWFKNHLNSQHHIYEYLSPELIEYITKEISSREKAPQGWQTVTSISQQLNTPDHIVRSIAYRDRVAHPEWFKEYFGATKMATYYSPELIEHITKEIIQRNKM